MAVSVRMDVTLERELELVAKRQGITKSQFIVDAVERALGRKDPHELLVQIYKEYGLGKPGGAPRGRKATGRKPVAGTASAPVSTGERVRQKLHAQRDASMRDWLAFQKAKKAGTPWSPEDAGA
jgi:hypothetical protein